MQVPAHAAWRIHGRQYNISPGADAPSRRTRQEEPPLEANARLQRSPNATFQVVAGEAILIHLHTGAYYSLNDVGTAFWQMLDGARTLNDCAGALAAEYNAPPEVVLADLIELAGDLAREGLVEQPLG
jgi:hypothetical protein